MRSNVALRCTALHCNSTRSVHHADKLAKNGTEASGTHSSPQMPHSPSHDARDAQRCARCRLPQKKAPMCPQSAMHLAENSTHIHTTAPIAPNQRARTEPPQVVCRWPSRGVSLATGRTPSAPQRRLTVARTPPSPAVLPCFHTSTHRGKQRALARWFELPCVPRELADAWRTSPLEGSVASFFLTAVRPSYLHRHAPSHRLRSAGFIGKSRLPPRCRA